MRYNELFESGWYTPERIGSSEYMGTETAREADIAFGSRFHNCTVHEFVSFIEYLMQRINPILRRSALYIIEHTVPTFGENAVVIKEIFYNALEQLLRDGKNQVAVTTNIKFFKANLSSVDAVLGSA